MQTLAPYLVDLCATSFRLLHCTEFANLLQISPLRPLGCDIGAVHKGTR